MLKRLVYLTSILLGMVAALTCLSARAQMSQGNTMVAPSYGSDASVGPTGINFNTPEADGRPGMKFYAQGMKAYHREDYAHAVYMLKVSASWAYKPAEYNLGIIYYKGLGVQMDRPLGTAWMFLAAERGTPHYVYARHVMVTSLDSAERAQAYASLQALGKTYGDKVALRRAKTQWALVKSSMTGSRTGAAGYLLVGGGGSARAPALYGRDRSLPGAAGVPGIQNGWEIFKNGDVTDGSIAYQQFQQSDNPYDPIFLKNHGGTITVEPLRPVKPDKQGAGRKPAPTPPQQPARNA